MNAKELIMKYEGYKSTAYLCPAKIWTIGWGFTLIPEDLIKIGGSTTLIKVPPNSKIINKDTAEAYLDFLILDVSNSIKKELKVQITNNQLEALISFVFNLGIGSLKKSTLLKLINSQKFNEASKEFLKWNKAGGIELKGLTIRRQEEMNLFLS
jgi:lysozyme